jgi:hypothetical protein
MNQKSKNNLRIYAEDFELEDEDAEAFLMEYLGEYVAPNYKPLPKGYKFVRHEGYWEEKKRKTNELNQ